MKTKIVLLVGVLICSITGFAQNAKHDSKAVKLLNSASALVEKSRNTLSKKRHNLALSNALVKVDSALIIDPAFAQCYLSKATIQGKLGKYTDGIATLDKLIALKEELPMAYTAQGFLYEMLGSKPEAIEKYKLALKEYDALLVQKPNRVSVLINRAAIIGFINGETAGKQEFQNLFVSYPNDKDVSLISALSHNNPREFRKSINGKDAALKMFK